MPRKYLLWLIASSMLFTFLTTKAFPEEQCTARYDITNNVVHIPCVTIGDKKIWANLRLTPSENTFVVEGYGENFLPLWLMQKIDGFIKESATDRPLFIRQFGYKGTVVYHFTSQCCDQFNYLYDVAGSIICAPDGGFSGGGDGLCPDFANASTAGTVIWEDTKN
ncbi:hypothetical protein [Nitrosomonas sp.]|uniref:DUF6970 domain-containing protein n=1 Tax=Nitrosomonas sp. TaxID=42353 RepID=UPI0025ED9578|nr:hypothetical protein [Nitrosomonas sp.]